MFTFSDKSWIRNSLSRSVIRYILVAGIQKSQLTAGFWTYVNTSDSTTDQDSPVRARIRHTSAAASHSWLLGLCQLSVTEPRIQTPNSAQLCILCRIRVGSPDPVNENHAPSPQKLFSQFLYNKLDPGRQLKSSNLDFVPGLWTLLSSKCSCIPSPRKLFPNSSTICWIWVDNPDSVNGNRVPI